MSGVIGVRAPNWVGDCVIATAAVQRLRQRLPDARLEVWVQPRLAPLFSAVAARVGATLHALPSDRTPGRLRASVRAIRGSRLNAILLLAPSLRAGLEAALAGVPIRVGYPDDGRAWLLTHPVYRRHAEPVRVRPPFARHILEEGLEAADHLAQALGAPACDLELPRPFIAPPPEARQQAREVLARVHPRPDRPLVGINPLSRGGVTRSWPLERYGQLVEQLRRHIDPDLVVLGGPDEWQAVDALIAAVGRPPYLTGLAGVTSLPLLTFAALAPELSVLVTNDTGPMHLAAAMGTRLVAIFGSTRPELTGPVGAGHRCLHLHALPCAGCYRKRCPYGLECLNGITPAMVLDAVIDQCGAS